MDTHNQLTSKHDLVLAYFPGLSFSAAKRKFERRINDDPFIMKYLKNQNYKKTLKKLNRKQLRTLYKVFGPPQSDKF